MEHNFKVGDRVRVVVPSINSDTLPIGFETVILGFNYSLVSVHQKDGDIGNWYPSRFELIEKEWSEWEHVSSVRNHSQYYEGCGFQREYKRDSRGNTYSSKVSINLKDKPKTVKVSELKGTVEMKDGQPDWSTYRE